MTKRTRCVPDPPDADEPEEPLDDEGDPEEEYERENDAAMERWNEEEKRR